MQNDLLEPQQSRREFACWQKAQGPLLDGRYGSAVTAYHELVRRHPKIA